MPKKPNSSNQLQEYVPAGNGDASGEYADDSGNNIHFFTKFEKPKSEVKNIEQQETIKEEVSKPKDAIKKETKKVKTPKEEIELDVKTEKKSKSLDEIVFENKNAIKQIPIEDLKNVILSGYGEQLDSEKINNLTDAQAKKLAIALNVVNAKDEIYSKVEDEKQNFLNKVNEIQKEKNIWKNIPSDIASFEKSIDEKIAFYKAHDENTNTDKIDALENLKKDLENWKEAEEGVEGFNKYQKLVDSYENPNNVYSQKAKDKAVWAKSKVSSNKIFGAIAEKTINLWKSKDPHAIQMVKDYTGSYSSINNPLRNIGYKWKDLNPEKKEEFIDHIEGITKVLDSSTYDFNCWVQRGVDKLNVNDKLLQYGSSEEELKKLVGTSFQDQGFMSCGTHKGGGFASSNIIMNIYCPKGTKMLYVPSISHYPGEDETIIQRGYTYNITKAEKKNGIIYLDCEVVLGSDINKHNLQKLEELKEKHF